MAKAHTTLRVGYDRVSANTARRRDCGLNCPHHLGLGPSDTQGQRLLSFASRYTRVRAAAVRGPDFLALASESSQFKMCSTLAFRSFWSSFVLCRISRSSVVLGTSRFINWTLSVVACHSWRRSLGNGAVQPTRASLGARH